MSVPGCFPVGLLTRLCGLFAEQVKDKIQWSQSDYDKVSELTQIGRMTPVLCGMAGITGYDMS